MMILLIYRNEQQNNLEVMKMEMRLQGIGMVEAVEAGTLKVGDITRWNFGGLEEITSIEFSKTGKTIIVGIRYFNFKGEVVESSRKFRTSRGVNVVAHNAVLVSEYKYEIVEEVKEVEAAEVEEIEVEHKLKKVYKKSETTFMIGSDFYDLKGSILLDFMPFMTLETEGSVTNYPEYDQLCERYAKDCGEHSAESYDQNFSDMWNDYIRAYEKINQVEATEVEAAEAPQAATWQDNEIERIMLDVEKEALEIIERDQQQLKEMIDNLEKSITLHKDLYENLEREKREIIERQAI